MSNEVNETTSRLRSWREAAELSLAEVSDLTGMSVSMLSRVERGERGLTPLGKVALARRLGVRIRDLFDVAPMYAGRAVE